MDGPTVSVCVPMYNNSATIARCLRSILDQDGVEFEIVVVDDDSSDDSVAIAAKMLRLGDRLVRNQPRLGLAPNHNRCLELARGTCIQFVHADDWLLPDALRRLSRCFDDPTIGMAFAPRHVQTDNLAWKAAYATPHAHFTKLREYNEGRSLVTQMALRGLSDNWIGEPTSVMFRRRLALEIGGFRHDIYQLLDLDFWIRLMLRSRVRFLPEELSVRNHTMASESIRNWTSRRDWLDRLRVLTWIAADPSSSTGLRIIAGLWWLPVWVRLGLRVMRHRPQRWSRMKILAQAPFREFVLARRLRSRLTAGADHLPPLPLDSPPTL
ncbi:glycosyltransferase [Mycobacterium sp. OTB74]|uniref:glycosyltransferase family 2 protein n=1 Tax=Mycobacterium sp. OTB74 TaxID=1853452 RepID=UPI0024744D66|nr:glycosyltransferase [Mycobacterium sp. OTB74]